MVRYHWALVESWDGGSLWQVNGRFESKERAMAAKRQSIEANDAFHRREKSTFSVQRINSPKVRRYYEVINATRRRNGMAEINRTGD